MSSDINEWFIFRSLQIERIAAMEVGIGLLLPNGDPRFQRIEDAQEEVDSILLIGV